MTSRVCPDNVFTLGTLLTKEEMFRLLWLLCPILLLYVTVLSSILDGLSPLFGGKMPAGDIGCLGRVSQ